MAAIFIFGACSPVRSAMAASWPFDQRNILLAKSEGREFPNDLTVAQILDVFVKRGRVRWTMEKGGIGQITPVEVPKDFTWQSSVSVKNLGLRYKVDGIVLLQQKGTELDLRWYSTVDGEPLFFEKVNLPAAGPGKEEEELRKRRLNDWLEDIWLRIPGRGYIVKRDMTTVSFEGAAQAGVKVGDTLEIKRLEETERHPLLKTLIGINSTLSGLATVTKVAEPFSTAKISYESAVDPIQEGDRYDIKIAPSAKTAVGSAVASPETKMADDKTLQKGDRVFIPLIGDDAKSDPKKEADDNALNLPLKYKLLDLTGRFGWSSLTHSESEGGSSPASHDLSGSGPDLSLIGRGYITRSWIVDGKLGFSHYSASGLDPAFKAPTASMDVTVFRLAIGYRFIFLEDPETPGEFTFSAGYQRYSFSVTQLSSSIAPQSKAYGSLDIGITLKVPVYKHFSLFAEGTRLIGASATESPLTTSSQIGSTVWNFELGGAYKINSRGSVSLGLESSSANTTFDGSVAQRGTPALSALITSTNFFAGYTHSF